MKKLFLILITLALISCSKPDYPAPNNLETNWIKFQVIGLSTDVQKHITIQSGGFILDTIIVGNLTYKVKVHQSNMYSKLTVKSNVDILDKLIISNDNDYISSSSDCPWKERSINGVFLYE